MTYLKDVRKYIIREEEAQLVAMISKNKTILEREQKSPKFGLWGNSTDWKINRTVVEDLGKKMGEFQNKAILDAT